MTPGQAALEELIESLQQALEERAWETVSVLDQRCRAQVAEFMADPSQQTPELMEQLRRLSYLFDELIHHCRADRDDAHRQLHQLNHGKQAIKAYQSQNRRF